MYFLLIFFFSFLHSQQSGQKALDLQECIQIAKNQNFDILLTQSNINAAGAGLTNAFGNYLPSIRMNSGFNRTRYGIFISSQKLSFTKRSNL